VDVDGSSMETESTCSPKFAWAFIDMISCCGDRNGSWADGGVIESSCWVVHDSCWVVPDLEWK
jgi:hypothetical protein